MKFATKTALVVALLASLVSFAKFDHCRNSGWAVPDQYVHACYSDLPALFSARGLTTHTWPYSSATNSVEYPPVTAMVMWGTSYLVAHDANQYRNYFDINALLIALLFIGSILLLRRMKPDLWYLGAAAPAVIASMYINWDMWAVLPAIAAIYLFDNERYELSALLLGLATATKFFPIVLVLPIALILIRRQQLHNLMKYMLISVGSAIAINLPFAMTHTTGWWRFFKLNSDRGADWGSLWHALSVFGFNVPHLNLDSILLFLMGVTAYILYFLKLERVPSLASSSFFVVAIFVTASKVYSPQYILWLTPLAVLALRDRKDRAAFWVWQGAELSYHLAIWEYFAGFEGAKFGLPAHWYAAAALARISALGYFAWSITRKERPSTALENPQNPDFSPRRVGGYA
jgi:uncharacterized membrane protein